MVAHHWTQAERRENAIPLWLKAGGLAISRVAMIESVGHLTIALRLILALDPSKQRDGLEFECRLLAGLANMALKGWAHPDVNASYAPAIKLARLLGREKALSSAYLGLSMNALVGARMSEAQEWKTEGLETAERIDDDEMRVITAMSALVIEFFAGHLESARKFGDSMLRVRERFDCAHVVHAYNHDPGTLWGIYAAQWLWLLGYPDQARRIGLQNVEYARTVGHPFDTGFALGFGSSVFHYLDDTETLLRRAKDCASIGAEHNLPFIQHLQAVIPLAFARAGSPSENETVLRRLVDLFESLAVIVMLPYYRCLMAEQVALDGRLDEAMDLADAALERVEGPAAAERVYYPEMLRIRASIARMRGDASGAEQFLRRALSTAREQSAKSWELRAATDLSRCLVASGRRSEGLDLLKPIYDWFTEGRDAKDHIEARALIAELSR